MNFRHSRPLEVVVGDNRLPVRGVRRMALLIRLLVSANRVVPAWRLTEDVWDGSGATRTPSTLASHVFMLRDVLGRIGS